METELTQRHRRLMHHTEFAYRAEIGSEICPPPAVIFPTTIYMFGFSKETSHLDGSFEYPEEIQMIFFFKIRKLTSPNDISNH